MYLVRLPTACNLSPKTLRKSDIVFDAELTPHRRHRRYDVSKLLLYLATRVNTVGEFAVQENRLEKTS